MDAFKIDDRQIAELAKKLAAFSKHAIPVASLMTLNRMAFQGRTVNRAIKLHAIVDRAKLPKEQRAIYDHASVAYVKIANVFKTEKRMLETHPTAAR